MTRLPARRKIVKSKNSIFLQARTLSSSTQLICRGLQPGEEGIYLEFAQKAWGENSPQAQAGRLDWLYKYNPNTRGQSKDLLVLVDGSVIVGAHHRMRIPWNVHGQRVIVPSFHDLFVLASHRHGEGSQLVLAALAGERYAALFGLSGPSDEIYSRMRVPSVSLKWLYKWRKMSKGVLQYIAGRINGMVTPRYKRLTGNMHANGLYVVYTDSPTPKQIEEALRIRPKAAIYPDWDSASYLWRFFHPEGPDNTIFIAYRSGAIAGRAVTSLGFRKGVVTGRVVEFVAEDQHAQDALLRAVESALDVAGAPVLFAATSEEQLAQALVRYGWKLRKDPPGARWFARKLEDRTREIFVSGGVWDFGCDLNLEHP